MPEQVEKHEIEIDWHGEVAQAVSDEIKSLNEDRDIPPIQEVYGDEDDMTALFDVYPPIEILNRVKGALRRVGHEDIPDGIKWDVVEIDIAVNSISTVTIEVRNP